MRNLIRSEMYKMFRSPVFLSLIGLMACLIIFVISLDLLNEYGLLDKIDNITVEVESDNPLSGSSLLYNMIEMPTVIFIYLYISVLGAFYISHEYTLGMMKHIVSTGHNRLKVYLAKFITFALSSILLFGVLIFLSFTLGSLAFGIGEWPIDWSFIYLSKQLLLIVLSIISMTAIVMVFSIATTNGGIALITSFIFYVIFHSGLNLLAKENTFAQKIQDYSIFVRLTKVSNDTLSSSLLWESICLSIFVTAIALLLGVSIFYRKDIFD